MYVDDGTLYVALVNEGAGLTVANFNASNGDWLGEVGVSSLVPATHSLSLYPLQQTFRAPWLSLATSCVLSVGHVTCVEASRLDLYHAALAADSAFSLTLLPVSLWCVAAPAAAPLPHRVRASNQEPLFS